VARLEREELDYAVTGAMALVAHGYRRLTEDVNILLTPEALGRFREKVEELAPNRSEAKILFALLS
jgi:hypothetical protein